ncbi:membrane protein [Paucimonas lemoignei]|nr:membrane protein [Paucimonas lemoignei]
MTDKNGTLTQRRDARFPDKPLSGTGTCPFKGPDIAIVPMRYALDRSRYDIDPAQLTPLSAETQWEYFKPLQSRGHTLRQLRDGFVYVYDETAEVLHEYRYDAKDASLTRVDWAEALPTLDIRPAEGERRTHLLYRLTHKLRIAFSPWQWTCRMCQLMSSSGVNRMSWMRELDLREYSRKKSTRHGLPLTRLSNRVVADVDPYPINHDGRFTDSAHPPVADEEDKYPSVALAADVLWTGTVPDKESAVLIALDDPVAMLEDLGMQLAADQAALFEFQAEHEHALNIAGVVENLCGVGGDKALLPASVRDDEVKTRQYIHDIEAYFEQLQVEHDLKDSADGQALGLIEAPSAALGEEIKARYGALPNPELRTSWQSRRKWRREVDLDAARDYSAAQQAQLKTLRARITDTQEDIKVIAEWTGTKPMRLFVDTTHPASLLCLLDVMSDLLCNLSQDLSFSSWLQKEEEKSKTLLGLTRFGFSQAIKEALTGEANRIMQGVSDFTALAGRAGELNGFLNHQALAEKSWIKTLTGPARLTLSALEELAKGAGRTALENIQLAFLPVDSRLSKGAVGDSAALMLRNLVMGHVLLSHPEKMQINEDFAKRHAAWRADLKKGRDLYQTAQHRWLYQANEYDRRATAKLMQDIQREQKLHLLNEPKPFDYHSKRYAEAMQNKISSFFARNGQLTQEWTLQAKAWSAEHGLNAAAITWGIAAINLFNTMITYEIASRDGELSKKDWAKVTSAAAYTGNALMAVFVETGWLAMKDLGALDEKGEYKKITQKSAAQWRRSGRPEFGKLIKGFGPRLVGLGGFSVVAASLELWDIWDDLQGATGLDRSMLWVKGSAVSAMIGFGLAQIVAGTMALVGDSSYLSFVMSPWFAGAVVIVGLLYLFAVLALNYLKRDVIADWLRKCIWTRYPAERFKSQREENVTFQEIQLSPALFVKPTMEMKLVNVGDIGYQVRELPSGAWLQLRIPATLRGETIYVNSVTSYRPSQIMPVTALDGGIHEYLIDHGSPESIDNWGRTSDKKAQRIYDVEVCKVLPDSEEDIIWQAWVPIDDKAKYLELQVWYSQEALTAREDDKGYRFQVELVSGGTYDNKESRMPRAASGSLPVEKLGGRGNAAMLWVPW